MGNTRVIGLDIGSSCVRAAELEFGSGGPMGKTPPTLVRFGQVALPLGAVRDGEVVQPETVSSAIRQLWAQAKFESKDVVIGVGNQRVVVRELDLPWMPLAQLKASLPYQVSELLPMSSDDALLDYFPTAESDGPQGRTVHGMLVAAQRDTVNANVIAVEGAGLRPRMVDLNAFALHRALARGELARATAAFVDIGATITTVVISAQGSPRLVRSLPTGGQNVTAAVASALGIAAASARSGPTPPRPSAPSCGPSWSPSGTRSSTTRATTPAQGSTSACSPVGARTCPASGSTSRARAGCPSPSVTRSPVCVPRRPCSATR